MHVLGSHLHAACMPSPQLTKGRHSSLYSAYAVTLVTRQRQRLFGDPAMSVIVRAWLRQSDHEGSSQTHAWVVMPDHLHWLFALRNGELSDRVRRFKSRSARAINQARQTCGAVWQAGFHDHRLRDDEDLLIRARYIIANPLRAGLVEDVREYPHWGCRWISRDEGLAG